jgi:argininosuccinate lyase
MPQKKNPDFAELIRGKTGRVVGDLTGLLVTLKGLPLAYNKDMQEDKECVFDAADTVAACLKMSCGMVETMRVHEERMRAVAGGGFTAATDVADHLVREGVPFRQAHEVVGRIVLDCERAGRSLQDLTVDDFRHYAPEFGEDVLTAVDPERVVARRSSAGGTGHGPVRDQIERQKESIARDDAWLSRVAS